MKSLNFTRTVCNILIENALNFKGCRFSFHNVKCSDKMDRAQSTNSNSCIISLTERLTKAEARLKVLAHEISNIKKELGDIRPGCTTFSRTFSTAAPLLLPVKRPSSEVDSESHQAIKLARYEFKMEDDYVVVYTDGACENNGQYNAKAGIGVWFANNHPLNVSEPVVGRATNNAAEIQACTRAINNAHENGIAKLKIKTDSQFVMKSMTQWIHKWKKNNWKLVSGGAVKNKEDFVKLDNACRSMQDVKWEYVAGHQGIDGNERADQLAREGAIRYNYLLIVKWQDKETKIIKTRFLLQTKIIRIWNN